jgi:hypothetical protein
MTEESYQVKDIIEATTALVKAVPVYEDALQPAARDLGQALHVVGKALNAALLPIEGLIWGVEKIRDFVHTRVAQKLQNTPTECIRTPDPAVAGPILESLRYTGHHEALRELYANLLANAIDERTAREAHPGFVEIIRNLSPDEARILKFLATHSSYPIINIKRVLKKDGGYIVLYRHLTLLSVNAGCQHAQLTPSYVENLERLGLIRVPYGAHLKDDSLYGPIRDHPQVKALLEEIGESEEHKAEIEKRKVEVTPLGAQFINACVVDKAVKV